MTRQRRQEGGSAGHLVSDRRLLRGGGMGGGTSRALVPEAFRLPENIAVYYLIVLYIILYNFMQVYNAFVGALYSNYLGSHSDGALAIRSFSIL